MTIFTGSVPTSVNWYAFTYNGPDYTGGGNFYGGSSALNPGFEGVAGTGTTTPEPSLLLFLGMGLAGLFGFRRFRTARQAIRRVACIHSTLYTRALR